MISIDTWVVIEVDADRVIVECPFLENNSTMTVPMDEIGECEVGDVLSTESGGWLMLDIEELKELSDDGRKTFNDYMEKRGFTDNI